MRSVFVILLALLSNVSLSFDLADYTHYIDYLPYRQEGRAFFDDEKTAENPPVSLRNRKMHIGISKVNVEDVFKLSMWPNKWPYGFEDFRPLDYTRDEVTNTAPQYEFSASLIKSGYTTIIPGLFRLPIKRHFILPKDKMALKDHMKDYFFDGAQVLELFSCYESVLPSEYTLGPTIGVGWYGDEMKCNPSLDDYVVQDVSMDPFLPLADNYFDFVVVPAMFQLFQRPLEMFQEINRVLKPGGTAIIGVKLAMWSFLGWKQGRYYVETSYLEDVLAAGSFFHYAQGFSKPEAFDLTRPEDNIIGYCKDRLFPNPRVDFYACVEARKRKDSPHGRYPVEKIFEPQEVTGERFQPRVVVNPSSKEENFGPFY